METFDTVMNIIAAVVIIYFIYWIFKKGIYCPQEKETIVVERLGKYHSIMSPGINCIVPILDRTKKIAVKYMVNDLHGNLSIVKKTSEIITTQNEVLDFPRQYLFCCNCFMCRSVITRDNAKIYIDAVFHCMTV